MTTHKVFIFWTNPLFHDSVRALLKHPDIEWVGASSNYAIVEDQIANCPADTIVVEEVEGKIPADIVQLLNTNIPKARIVGLNFQNNQAQMYHRVMLTVGKADDLLNWILTDNQ